MKSIAINGITFQRKELTGIERYVFEIIRRMDKNIPDDMKVFLLCPQNTRLYLPELKKICLIRLNMKGIIRRTLEIRRFLKKKNAFYFDLTGALCLAKNTVGCIHDIRYKLFKTYDPFIWRFRGEIDFLSYKLFARKIVTVSETSKQEICKNLKIKEEHILVISPGWNHMLDIEEDVRFWEKYKNIKKGAYYYTIASLMPHKNFKWIYENAKNNPDKLFIIAGKDVRNESKKALKNVIYLGYITDAENKTLMKNCISFIYPAKYEGFGLPPLEALSCGAPIMISDIKVFHEIFEGCATFFDTEDYRFDFENANTISKKCIQTCLDNYNFDNAAENWLKLMYELG